MQLVVRHNNGQQAKMSLHKFSTLQWKTKKQTNNATNIENTVDLSSRRIWILPL